MTFRVDGTYSARALVSGDDPALHDPAFYYGTDDDLPEKLYALNDLQDGLGVGQIDIVFWEGNVNRGELRDVELMDNQLQFEFFHRGQYGPLSTSYYGSTRPAEAAFRPATATTRCHEPRDPQLSHASSAIALT